MSGWLTRQRKQTLLDLSEEAGLPQCVASNCHALVSLRDFTDNLLQG